MAKDAQQQIIEFLLLNHPLDCPICDRAGECPLQDNTMKVGPGKSRFYEEKRHFKKPLPLGPLVMLDRERCIACARCTRFCDELSGDHALEFLERGYRMEVGTVKGKAADSKFIGNTIMICPVGALTSQPYRFQSRPWDNTSTETTCTLCPVGCRMILDARDGQIMRTRSLENRDVNDIWLCDKGWFGYEFTRNPERLTHPLIRRQGELVPASWEEALAYVVEKIQKAKPFGKLAALGGNPLTFEENYLLQQLMRKGVGVPHVDHRVGMPIFSLEEEGIGPGMEMAIGECEELKHVVLCGLDLTEEFPVIWLRIRQAIHKGAKVTFLGNFAPEISAYLSEVILHPPGQENEILQQYLETLSSTLDSSQKGAFFVGSQYLATDQRKSILQKLSEFQNHHTQFSLNVMEGKGNSLGARLGGMHPQLGPLGEETTPGWSALEVLQKASETGWDFLYVVGCNPALKVSSHLWKEARSKLNCLVVQELFLTETARQADVVLPTLNFAEKGGSFVNIEGRIQPLVPGKEIPENLYSDGEIFNKMGRKLNFELKFDPVFEQLLSASKVSLKREKSLSEQKEKKNFDGTDKGKLRSVLAPVLFDRGIRMQHNPHLSRVIKDPLIRIHPQEGVDRDIQSGDTVKIQRENHEVIAKVKWDKSIAKGTVVMPTGFEDQFAIQNLGLNGMNGKEVEVLKDISN